MFSAILPHGLAATATWESLVRAEGTSQGHTSFRQVMVAHGTSQWLCAHSPSACLVLLTVCRDSTTVMVQTSPCAQGAHGKGRKWGVERWLSGLSACLASVGTGIWLPRTYVKS